MWKAKRDYIYVQCWLWLFIKGERGPMTWLHKYEMYVGCCWHITAKDRPQINIHTLKAFTHSLARLKCSAAALRLLFWWAVQVAFMDRNIVYGSIYFLPLFTWKCETVNMHACMRRRYQKRILNINHPCLCASVARERATHAIVAGHRWLSLHENGKCMHVIPMKGHFNVIAFFSFKKKLKVVDGSWTSEGYWQYYPLN